MDIEKWTKGVFYIGVIIWLGLAVFHVVSQPMLYLILGVLILVVGLKNAVLLYRAGCGGEVHVKIWTLMDRMGDRNGLLYYATFMVALVLLGGAMLVVYGWMNVGAS